MVRCMYISVLLCCVGCSSRARVTIYRITRGMTLDEVRTVAGELEWVASTPETHSYRGWFKEKPNSGIFGTYPVLLIFDSEAILVDYRRDWEEELRLKKDRDLGTRGGGSRGR